ncbi:MAG TPA: O-antigen ligase family protein [Gaiellaceae bacterium]|nr:O-antigen ligase family protein [Gaiellaceae bacterium]
MRKLFSGASPAALVLALAVPFVFLHTHYQPHLAAGQVDVDLTDLAMLAALGAAIWDGRTRGWAPLRAAASIWRPLGAFLVLLLLSLLWARHYDPAYGLGHHLVSALKFCEYVVLAPAAALALRTRDDRRVFLWAVALWTSFLSLIALLQFLGLVHEFEGRRPEQREPSYIGIHDLGALAGAALSMLFASIVLPPVRSRARVAGIAGAFGVALAAAFDAVGGTCVAAIAIWGVARRRARISAVRTVSLVVLCAVVTVAAVQLRSNTIVSFLSFLGVRPPAQSTSTGGVESWQQRVLLGYIGVKIWEDHLVVGTGWQESELPHAFEPHLAAARERFSSQPAQAFPSPQHEWGVQNGVVQTLSDLGIVGLVLLAAFFFAAFRLLVRVALRAPPALARQALATTGWVLLSLAVFTGTGLLAGAPIDAEIWLGLGLAAALHHEFLTESD